MKKKIIFMIINMNVGGTEKALLNMINEFPKEKYDITILMLEKFGGFLKFVPENVEIKYINDYKRYKDLLKQPLQIMAIKSFKALNFVKGVKLLVLSLVTKLLRDRSLLYSYVLKDYRTEETEYDVAVAYAGPMDFISYFVINKIKAKKKIQWIHFDVTQIGLNSKFVSRVYKDFDKIFVVSEEGKNKLLTMLPKLKAKVETFLNMVSSRSIIEMAKEEDGFKDDFQGIRILTVGRLTKEKGQDLVIPVLAKLKNEGYNVRWYCIGDGGDRREYEKLVEEHNVVNDFIFLGSNPNPYPFMEQCDLYVQPSRHEGYCITLAEAKCFNKPIISTNFTGISEHIIHNNTGIIVNFDEQEMFSAIKNLLDDNRLLKRLEDNLRNSVIKSSVAREMNKIYTIVNG
ncbi:glycosyltransferase [Neobacillus sp. LXY-1]|uniref:glycosyltransferase n=1 Tax=Neobacillus sp. LXY-1 TaxID=3379133 RepID=UPI003EE052CE